jgi:eukaryotic-like serine/threonine-protein kinase
MPQYLRRALIVSTLALVSLGLVTVLVLAIRHLREHEVSAESTWFGVPPPDNAIFSGDVASVPSTMLALSPDGRRLAFVASQAGAKPLLWIRELNSMHVEALPGTDNAAYPFWSPDSKRIGYFADGKLHTILISGRAHEVLCDAPVGRGGTWSKDGTIVFAFGSAGPLYRISAEGGPVRPLTALDPVRGDHTHRWPHFLPDGQNFLYFTRSSSKAYQGIYAASLERTTGRLLRTSHTGAVYASGHILFVERGVLKAQPFDPTLLQLSGSAQTVARQVGGSTVHYGPMSVSNNGRLAYGSSVLPDSQLLWMDRSGTVLGRVGEPGDYTSVQVSPRGDRVAVGLVDPRSSTPDVWVIDLGRIPSTTRITRDPDDTDGSPVWSPDGQQLVFRSDRAGANNLYSKASRGQGEDQLVFSSPTSKFPTQWVAGRDLIVYHTQMQRGDWDVQGFALRQRESASIASTPANEVHGAISPDGRWLAYASDDSGSLQVYVEPVARRGERVRGSVGGGTQPRWRGDSRELYYVDENARAMFAVPIHTNGRVRPGSPVKLFDVRITGLANPFRNHYAVDPTGNRFLISTLLERPTSPPVTVVLNWLGAIEARAEWSDEQVPSRPRPLEAPSRS